MLHKKKFRLANIILAIFSVMVSYSTLVIGDYAVRKVASGSNSLILSESQNIIDKRKIEIDQPERLVARKAGFSSLIYPAIFDENENLIRLTNRLKIAPIGSQPNTKTYYCNEGYGLVRFTSDKYGLRNPNHKWDQPADTFFIGDSITHGACVEDAETIPAQYEDIVKKNILNLGSPANNPYHYAALAKIFIPIYQPKNIVLIFYPGDFGDFNNSNLYKFYVTQDQSLIYQNSSGKFQLPKKYNLLHKNKEWDAQNLEKHKPSTLFMILYTLRKHASLPFIRQIIFPKSILKKYFNPSAIAIKNTEELCEQYGCKLTVVYIPNSHFFDLNAYADYYENLLHAYAKSRSINFVSLTKKFDRGKNSKDYAPKGHHLSPFGYNKVAVAISNSLNY